MSRHDPANYLTCDCGERGCPSYRRRRHLASVPQCICRRARPHTETEIPLTEINYDCRWHGLVPEGHIRPYAVNVSTYGNHGCRCSGCTADAARNAREYRSHRASPEARRNMHRRRDRRFKIRNAEVVTNATAHKKPWTDEDFAIAWDRSISAAQAAVMLGRSINSVKHMRRRDPSRAGGKA